MHFKHFIKDGNIMSNDEEDLLEWDRILIRKTKTLKSYL